MAENFVPSTKDKNILIINGFQYYKNRTRGSITYWSCKNSRSVIPKCSATAKTDAGNIVDQNGQHNHPSNEAAIELRNINVGMKRRASLEATTINQIYRDGMAQVASYPAAHRRDIAQQLPAPASCKSALHKIRQKTVPPLPNNREDIVLFPPVSLTVSGDEFVLVDDGDANKILVFGMQESLGELCNANYVFMDGTFKSTPLLFFQTYVFAIVKAGYVIPLIYALLPNKSSVTYQRLFQLLKDKCANFGFQLQPANIMIDFEIAVIRSVRHNFRQTIVHGCFFHFQQSLWRKIQELGLSVLYKTDAACKRWVRQSGSLAFLPVAEVVVGWQYLVQHLPNASFQPYVEYFERTWAGSGNVNPMFSLELWNVSNVLFRTNNFLEGYNSRLNKMSGRNHPNIYQFIELIKKEHAEYSIRLLQIDGAVAAPPKRRKYIDIQDKINLHKTEYANGVRNLDSFLASVGNLTFHDVL